MIFFIYRGYIKYKVSPLSCRNEKRRINHSKVETLDNPYKRQKMLTPLLIMPRKTRQKRVTNTFLIITG